MKSHYLMCAAVYLSQFSSSAVVLPPSAHPMHSSGPKRSTSFCGCDVHVLLRLSGSSVTTHGVHLQQHLGKQP